MLVLAGLTLAVVLVLLVWLLTSGEDEGGGPAAPALPKPTLAIERGGFRYSIGVGPFAPATAAPGSAPVRPGRVVLTAAVIVRNDTDRPAPSLIDSNGVAPLLRVGLGGVTELPPTRSFGLPRLVSGCLNDTRNPSIFTNTAPTIYRSLAPPTCIVAATTRPASPTPTGVSDRTLAPGGINEGLVVTIELPASVPTNPVSVWLADATSPDGATVFTRIP